jgi:hypothetical protein
MISNVGYSSVQCASIPVDVIQLSLSCPYGTIGAADNGEPLDWGINLGQADARNCLTNEVNAKCTPDNPNLLKSFDALVGKSSGVLNIENDSDIFIDPAANQDCLGRDATLFIQFTCEQSAEQQLFKYEKLSETVAIGCLICLLFTVGIRYLYQGGKIKQLDWDMSTITAGDYTVEFAFERENYI